MPLALAETDGGLDLELSESGLVMDEGLGSAILLSFAADARARDEDVAVLDPRESRRGWWADEAGERFGSRLWLLSRRKATESLLAEAEQIATDALAWMIERGIATTVTASAEYVARGEMRIDVEIVPSAEQRWAFLWTPVREGRFEFEGCALGWRVA